MTHLLDWNSGDVRPIRLAAGCVCAVTGWDLYSTPLMDSVPQYSMVHPGHLVRSLLMIQNPDTQHALGVVLILFGFLLISTSLTTAPRH